MVRQYAAPAAALLVVTAAVLAVHYGIQKRSQPPPPPQTTPTLPARPHVRRAAGFTRFYVVQRGDSFSSIAVKTKTSVARLEQLNPKASPTALRVGQRIRVK